LAGPEIISRGFVHLSESEDLLDRARNEVLKTVQGGGGGTLLTGRIKEALTRFVYNETRRRPLILPMVMEV
jgi:ribonuclease J